MASLDQNFTKFAKDTFNIQFSVTVDGETTLEAGNNHAYWLAAFQSETATNNLYISKSTSGFPNEELGGITIAGNTVTVEVTKSDFGEWVDGTDEWSNSTNGKIFTHELTITDNLGSGSVIVSSGDFSINHALFPDSLRK